jgi:hypothetical protein
MQQRQAILIELLEELFPTDVLQGIRAAISREIQSQQACITFTARAPHARRRRLAFFGPPAYLIVVGCYLRFGGFYARFRAASSPRPVFAVPIVFF